MKRRKCRKPNATGRNSEMFVAIPHYVLKSDGAVQLSGGAFKVLIYVAMRFNGYNNGTIQFGVRSGVRLLLPAGKCTELKLFSRSRMASALSELERAGFIICTSPSSFDQKRLVREWAITWLGRDGALPTKEFAKQNDAGGISNRAPRQIERDLKFAA